MATTRQKKEADLDQIRELLASSRMTVAVAYQGVSVKELQELRRRAGENGSEVRVSKNRLIKLAVKETDNLKDADVSALTGQLLYVFNAEDEVAPAQVVDAFAKQQPKLQFAGAISAQGEFLDADQVKQLASLPSKDQLRGQLVGTIAAPLSGFVNVMAGNLRGLVNVLNARSESLNEQ